MTPSGSVSVSLKSVTRHAPVVRWSVHRAGSRKSGRGIRTQSPAATTAPRQPRVHTCDPIAQLLGRQVRRQPGHSCLVQEDMSHGHVPLAVCSELGPHLGQAQVVIDPASRDEDMHERAEDVLGGRTSEEQGSGGHGFDTDRIGDAALCVGDERAVLHHDGPKADLITVRAELV
jgi:hypothetical protein